LIIGATISRLQTPLVAVAGRGRQLAVDGTRRVPSDAAPLGVGALPVALPPLRADAVERLRAEPALDAAAVEEYEAQGRQNKVRPTGPDVMKLFTAAIYYGP